MKNLTLALILFAGLFIIEDSSAQLCIKSVTLGFSNDLEMINDLSAEVLLSTIKEGKTFDQIPFDKVDLESMNCENPTLKAGLHLGKSGNKSTLLYVGLSFIYGRYDGVTYASADEYSNYLHLESRTNQIGADFSYEKRLKLGFVNLYGGFGTTVGYSFRGKVNAIGENMMIDYQRQELIRLDGRMLDIQPEVAINLDDFKSETYKVHNSFDQRLFIQAGIGFRIAQRIELGLQGRYGYAYRLYGGGAAMNGKLYSLGISTKYLLHNCLSS